MLACDGGGSRGPYGVRGDLNKNRTGGFGSEGCFYRHCALGGHLFSVV